MRHAGRWRYEEVAWGETFCGAVECTEPAEVFSEGEVFCLRHADEVLERLVLVGVFPAARMVIEPI